MAESLLTRTQEKIFSAFGCLMCDIGLSLWFYFRATNYNEYIKYIKTITDSPDFQVQLYRVYMQSLTFGLLIFIGAHLVVYFLFWKDYRAAQVYLKYYSVCSSAGCLLITIYETAYAVVPMFIYGFAYYFIAKMIPKSSAKLQK